MKPISYYNSDMKANLYVRCRVENATRKPVVCSIDCLSGNHRSNMVEIWPITRFISCSKKVRELLSNN